MRPFKSPANDAIVETWIWDLGVEIDEATEKGMWEYAIKNEKPVYTVYDVINVWLTIKTC